MMHLIFAMKFIVYFYRVPFQATDCDILALIAACYSEPYCIICRESKLLWDINVSVWLCYVRLCWGGHSGLRRGSKRTLAIFKKFSKLIFFFFIGQLTYNSVRIHRFQSVKQFCALCRSPRSWASNHDFQIFALFYIVELWNQAHKNCHIFFCPR